MNNKSFLSFCEKMEGQKTRLKVFLAGGNKEKLTMLSGVIRDYHEDGILLDSCWINFSYIVSISPNE